MCYLGFYAIHYTLKRGTRLCSLLTKNTFFLGGGCVPYYYTTKSVRSVARSVVLDHLYRDSKTSFFPKRARLFTTTCTRANKAAGYYRPFVFVLFVFVSLEEDKEEDKDEKEGFGVSLGVVRV